jgi:hypothetical protein
MTQAERVLVLLAVRGPEGVSVLDFAPGFRLAARIADLRAAGNPIDTQTATLPGGAKVARYVLTAATLQPTTGTQTEAFR